MWVLRLLLIGCVCFSNGFGKQITYYDEGVKLSFDTNVVGDFLALLLRAQWEENKEETLVGIAEMFEEHNLNISFIATEDIYGENGELEAIKILELLVPGDKNGKNKKGSSESSEEDNSSEEDDDEEDDEEMLKVLTDAIQSIHESAGLTLRIGYKKYDLNRTVVEKAYLDNVYVYEYEEDMATYNITTAVTKDQVTKLYEHYKQANKVPPTLIHQDVDGKVIEKDSIIPRDVFLVDIQENNDTPWKVLNIALAEYSKLIWTHPEEVPKQLGLHLKKTIPTYNWIVLEGTANFQLPNDFNFILTNSVDTVAPSVVVIAKQTNQ